MEKTNIFEAKFEELSFEEKVRKILIMILASQADSFESQGEIFKAFNEEASGLFFVINGQTFWEAPFGNFLKLPGFEAVGISKHSEEWIFPIGENPFGGEYLFIGRHNKPEMTAEEQKFYENYFE